MQPSGYWITDKPVIRASVVLRAWPGVHLISHKWEQFGAEFSLWAQQRMLPFPTQLFSIITLKGKEMYHYICSAQVIITDNLKDYLLFRSSAGPSSCRLVQRSKTINVHWTAWVNLLGKVGTKSFYKCAGHDFLPISCSTQLATLPTG